MPCLKLNGHSINPDCDVAMRLFGRDTTIRFATFRAQSHGNGGNGEQFGITLGRAREDAGSVVSPQARVTEGARCNARFTWRCAMWRVERAKKLRPNLDVFEKRAGASLPVGARLPTIEVCQSTSASLTDCNRGQALYRKVVSTPPHSPPARHGTSLCTCRACPRRCRAWCGSPGPAR